MATLQISRSRIPINMECSLILELVILELVILEVVILELVGTPDGYFRTYRDSRWLF